MRMDSAAGAPGGSRHRLIHGVRTRLSRRLRETELRYRTLFERISDGFALVEVIRDEQGQVIDYVVLEANPALLRLLGFESSLIGKRQSEVLRGAPPGWLKACQRAMDGEPLSFDYHAQRSDRWFEIHLTRVGERELAQLIVEVTDRKWNEHRTSEMFDELNHRVKNNLALVCAMLGMQARAADTQEVREQLAAAIERVQTIADVHASLYSSSRKDDVDFARYLGDLCERLSKSVLDSERISLEVKADVVVLPLDRAVVLGLIVNELVTNAAKHAYPPPASGGISVRLDLAENGLVLAVADWGRGLPAEPPRVGLGMRIVRSLVQQLGGRLSVEQHPGSTFRVHVPALPAARDDVAKQGALF